MRGPRFTIASMLVIVGLLAVGMAALFSSAGFWISVAATSTLGMLLAAVLGAILLRGGERAFCLGFCLFAGTYLVLVDWDWIGGQFGHDLTLGLSDLAERVYPDPAITSSASVLTQLPLELLRLRQGKIGNFVEVGRMFSSILFGLFGGYAGIVLERRRERAGLGRDAT
jgi:hypothetical protein